MYGQSGKLIEPSMVRRRTLIVLGVADMASAQIGPHDA
jgi:hypothetical protein